MPYVYEDIGDSHEKNINQEKADQDVDDEVSEGVDSRNEVIYSEKNDW